MIDILKLVTGILINNDINQEPQYVEKNIWELETENSYLLKLLNTVSILLSEKEPIIKIIG